MLRASKSKPTDPLEVPLVDPWVEPSDSAGEGLSALSFRARLADTSRT